MTTTFKRNHFSTDQNRSPLILERRRKLFPTDCNDLDMDSELGHISPLCSDTTSDSDNEGVTAISDYDIVGIVQNKKNLGNLTPVSCKALSETMSPLKLSPFTNMIVGETPTKLSPTQRLKTPHDTSTKSLSVLHKEQKTILEESKSLKRKSSPSSSPETCKMFKLDSKSSKVRTALFPPNTQDENSLDISLPTKTFYSKNQENILDKITANRDRYVPKPIKYNTNKHGYRPRKKFGQINNGVRHNIKKPNHKKAFKTMMTKATKKLLETGSVLKEYIQDLSELKKSQNNETKLIENSGNLNNNISNNESIKDPILNAYLRDIKDLQASENQIKKSISIHPQKNDKDVQNFQEGNKENISTEHIDSRPVSPLGLSSPEESKSRKFFKSARNTNSKNSKQDTKTLNSNIESTSESKKNDNHRFEFNKPSLQEQTKKIEFNASDLANDFEEEEMTTQTNIDSILSVLTSESPVKQPREENNVHMNHMNNDPINLEQNFVSYDVQSNVESVNHIESCNEAQVLSSNNNFEEILGSNQDISSFHITSNQVIFNENTVQQTEMLLKPIVSSNIPKNSSQTNTSTNEIILAAHNSVIASENSIQLHQNHFTNMVLSPISQMCNVTSGLALNSPKKGRNLTSLLNSMPNGIDRNANGSDSLDMEQKKLFPIFYGGAKATPDRGLKRDRNDVMRSAKRFRALSPDQMLLDAGQKKFGYTVCAECNTVYHLGDPGDELAHTNFHNATNILRFAGWKNEHIVATSQNARIIRIMPNDPKIWIKKVKDLMEVIKRDLGCYEMEYDITDSQVYLYIKNRVIAGCAVATVPKERGHRMLSTLNNVAMCSEESYPIRCGISHIWVAANSRKQGVATALMNAVKNNFFYGEILSNSDIALTSPTEAGAAFAEKYFKTPNYLVYYV